MYQKQYHIELNGRTDLLMHKDNIPFSERTQRWQKDPMNKKSSVKGDDRSPAWTWIGGVYHDDRKFIIDSDCLMSCLRDGGAKCPRPTGRGSLKSATQSGIVVDQIGWPLLVKDKEIPVAGIEHLYSEEDFEIHEETARKLGFTLFVKRARIGTSKHVRVRARFSNWSASGTITVLDKTLNKQMIETIWTFAGAQSGLCDWRPGSKTPGQFGTFTANVTEL